MAGGIKRAYKNPTLFNIGLGGLQTIGGGLNYLTSPISARQELLYLTLHLELQVNLRFQKLVR